MLYPLSHQVRGFPCGSAGKESTCNAGALGSIPGLGRSPGEGQGCSLQYSGQENSMDCIVHGAAKSRTRLSNFTTTCRWRNFLLHLLETSDIDPFSPATMSSFSKSVSFFLTEVSFPSKFIRMEVIAKDFRKVIYTLLYLKWINNKNLLYSTWNSAQCYVPAWTGWGFGEEWIRVYVLLSSFTVHLKLS